MAGKANNVTVESQEMIKKEAAYKVTCGTFKAKDKALKEAAEVKGKGINVSIIISNAEYTLLYSDGLTKSEAERVKKEIEAKKIKAEVSEQ